MSETATQDPKAQGNEKKLSDWQRFRQVGKYHGVALLAAVTLFGAADAWAMTTGLLIADVVAVLNAVVAGTVLAIIFHEWGHFIGARVAGAYSPMVRKPTNAFIFGFNFARNTSRQFLSMSIGGPAGNLLLVALVLVLVPLDSWGRAMLLAVVVARAVSVIMFEGPIIMRAFRGIDPEASLETGLNDGSANRGQVIGIASGALLWLATI